MEQIHETHTHAYWQEGEFVLSFKNTLFLNKMKILHPIFLGVGVSPVCVYVHQGYAEPLEARKHPMHIVKEIEPMIIMPSDRKHEKREILYNSQKMQTNPHNRKHTMVLSGLNLG